MYHGLADPFVSPLGSLDYYTAVIGATGGSQAVKDTQSFARLFLAPAVTYCGGGRVPTSSTVQTISAVRKIPTTMSSWGVVRLTYRDRRSPKQDARSHCRHRIPPFARRADIVMWSDAESGHRRER
jgi:hypothetical protein